MLPMASARAVRISRRACRVTRVVAPLTLVALLLVVPTIALAAGVSQPLRLESQRASGIRGVLAEILSRGSARRNSLVLVDLRTHKTRAIAVGLDFQLPTWAPSGRSVAVVRGALLGYASLAGETTGIEVLDRAGHVLANVAAPIPDPAELSWSPSERAIAIGSAPGCSGRSTSNPLRIVQLAGGMLTVPLAAPVPTGRSRWTVTYAEGWSPDSRRLVYEQVTYSYSVFESDPFSCAGVVSDRLFLVNADGSGRRLLVTASRPLVGDASFSPDGERVAYGVMAGARQRAKLIVFDLRSGRQRAVATFRRPVGFVSPVGWTRTGHLLYQTDETENSTGPLGEVGAPARLQLPLSTLGADYLDCAPAVLSSSTRTLAVECESAGLEPTLWLGVIDLASGATTASPFPVSNIDEGGLWIGDTPH